MEEMIIPYYTSSPTVNSIDKWLVNFDYKTFNKCVVKLIDENNIHITFRR